MMSRRKNKNGGIFFYTLAAAIIAIAYGATQNDAAFYIVVTFPALLGAFVLYAKDHAAIIEEERKASEEKEGNKQ